MAYNTAEGGTNGTTVTAANSGGLSGVPFDAPVISATCTLTFDNTHPAHGAGLSYKFQLGGTPGECYLPWTTQFTATNVAVASFRIKGAYFTANPGATIYLYRVANAAGANTFGLALDTAGKLLIKDGGGTIVATMATAIPLSTLFDIEVTAEVTGTTGTIRVWRTDVADSGRPTDQLSGTVTAAVPMGRIRWGHTGTGVATVGPWWYDDLETVLPDGVVTPPDTYLDNDLLLPEDNGASPLGSMYQPWPLQVLDVVGGGPINVDVDTATLVLAGIDPTLDGTGTATATADVAALTLAGQDTPLAGSGAATVACDVAALTLTGQDAPLSSGGLQVAVDTATLTLTGQDATLGGSGAASTTADVAALTLTGITPTAAGSGASPVTADVAALTLTGIDPTLAGTGAASVTADVAALLLAGQDTPLAGTGAASKAADVAALLLSGIDVAASAGGSFADVDPATLTFTGPTPAFAGTGAGTVAVDVAALQLAGQDTPLAGSGATAKVVDIAALVLAGQDAVLVGFVADTNPLTATFRVGHTATVRESAASASSRSRQTATVRDQTTSATATEQRN
jgi:hypothetical protein